MNRFLLLLLLFILLVTGCERRYKIINVPFCKTEKNMILPGFEEDLRYLYKSGDGYGVGPISGTRETIGLNVADSVPAKKMVLAVVSCARPQANTKSYTITTQSYPGTNPAKELTEKNLPTICPGQKKVFHEVLTAKNDPRLEKLGWNGVITMPKIRARCQTGTVAYTVFDQIKPRPQ